MSAIASALEAGVVRCLALLVGVSFMHRDEDTITGRLFQLEEELTRLRHVINKEKTSCTLLPGCLDNLELSIQDRNVIQTEELNK